MPITIRKTPQRFAAKIRLFMEDISEDLQEVGDAAADGIVESTLQGIGAGDQPFAPYSRSYAAALDRSGAKSSELVNLRGIYYHAGNAGVRRRRSKYVRITASGRRFLVRPKRTRQGITDLNSEMSRDLMAVKVDGDKVTISYHHRLKPYMHYHNDGSGKQPQRKWFSFDKSLVREMAFGVLTETFAARIEEFNRDPT